MVRLKDWVLGILRVFFLLLVKMIKLPQFAGLLNRWDLNNWRGKMKIRQAFPYMRLVVLEFTRISAEIREVKSWSDSMQSYLRVDLWRNLIQ